MNFLVPVALIGWIPAVLVLFMLLPPRRAVIAAFIIAWLFLPMAGFAIAGLPNYTKMMATCYGVLLGTALFDADRLLSYRWRPVDAFVTLFCVSPFISALVNNHGLYEATSVIVHRTITWGLPYIIGRIYFFDLDGLRELAIGIVVGGLVYVPLCWVEIMLSPQLHRWVYGYYQHAFYQTKRLGGWRPMVFMQHGLMLSIWMATTALLALWLWRTRAVRDILGVPMFLIVPTLLFTALMCRSAYAMILLIIGITFLYASVLVRTRVFMIALLCIAPTFITLRGAGLASGEPLIRAADSLFGPARASSVATRVNSEDPRAARAREAWFWGWGRGTASRAGAADTTVDSLWIITFGTAGAVGLVALLGMFLLPMVLVMRDYRVAQWSDPVVAPAVALALLLVLYMLDHLMNAMVNPVFMLAVGAVCGSHVWVREQFAAARAAAAAAAMAAPPPEAVSVTAVPAGGMMIVR